MGRLSLGFTVIVITVGIVRSFLLEPILLTTSNDSESRQFGATAISALVLTLPGVLLLVAGHAIYHQPEFLWLAASLPFVVVQDCGRYFAIDRDLWDQVASSDIGWLVVQLLGTSVAVTSGNYFAIVASYGAGAAFGLIVLLISVTSLRTPSAHNFARPFSMGRGLALEFLVGKGIGELMIPVVAATGSLSLAGSLRMVQLAVGPVNVFETATRLSATNEWRIGGKNIPLARRSFRRHTLTLAGSYGLVIILVFLEFREGSKLLHDIPLALLAGIVIERLLSVFSSADAFAIRLTGRTLLVARNRILTGGVIIISVAIGVGKWHELGLSLAFPLSALVGIAIWRHAARRVALGEMMDFRNQYSRQHFLKKRAGGGPITAVAFQPLASFFAFTFQRFNPSVVTVASAIVAVSCSWVLAFNGLGAISAAVAFLGWSIAYILDCTDGQMARAMGKSTIGGGRLDIFADTLCHSSIAFSVGLLALNAKAPVAVVLVFAITRSFGGLLFKSAPALPEDQQGFPSSQSRTLRTLVALKRLLFDFPVQCLILSVGLLNESLLFFAILTTGALSCLELAAFGIQAARSASSELSIRERAEHSSHVSRRSDRQPVEP